MNRLIYGDNLKALDTIEDETVDLIYIDPPFNTGTTRTLVRQKNGVPIKAAPLSYDDTHQDFIKFIRPRLEKAVSLLQSRGSIFVHLDYREVHYCKVLMDEIFGRENFRNEIIWAYDYGGRSKTRWSCKHDTILWYSKSSKYTFNYDKIDRVPYMAPGLVGPEKAALGKTPTDVWWCTITPTQGKERTGYPTQKPIAILNRIINVHSNPGDLVLDFFAGSGTTLVAAANLGRRFIGVDNNKDAIEVMKLRLKDINYELEIL